MTCETPEAGSRTIQSMQLHIDNSSYSRANILFGRVLPALEVKPNDPAVSFERTFLKGNTADEILSFSKKRTVDMIVMGTHGQTNSPDAVMGAVAETVTRHAPCLVIAVKPATVTAKVTATASVR